ncbi:DUF262 domain-containing protein [Methylobacterium sp. GXS13]|uniref:DUF262 domain-containing protein n=1 Tax=Methylobacterium sp. GXS13 TaxID=1730094 RepID=UPI001AED0ABD|nr:DUF262 domain-containing protein [Methylobacterium sp. GXS13]
MFTVFRQINGGELRIPAFQREFVWKNNQITDLLKSVRDQFPIGSVLLWHVNTKFLELARSDLTAFPDVSETLPTNYILDGMQRLSTLYGVFHHTEGKDARFDVYYDLRNKRFVHAKDLGDEPDEACIQLAALLSPRKLLDNQARIVRLSDGDALIQELLDVQAAFQEYMIPVVTIRSTDVARIVEIFERTNSTGTRLDTVDFMRAITWDRSFDLNRYLDEVRTTLTSQGYGLDDETVIKCVGLLLNVEPTAKGLLSLRGHSPDDLKLAFHRFNECFNRITYFLYENFRIENLSYVPYEGQFLVLFKAVGMKQVRTQEEFDLLASWFWAVGFNESLRGKPDHYVVRALDNWRALVRGQIRGLEPRLRLTANDFMERRMIKGRALSSAFSAMFALNDARDLTTTEVIDSTTFMSNSDPIFFHPIFDTAELRDAGFDVGSSSRLFSNLALSTVSHSIESRNIKREIVDLLERDGHDTLISQFIDLDAAEDVARGNAADFLLRRSLRMRAIAEKLVNPHRLVPETLI